MTAGLRMVRFFSTPEREHAETNLGQPRIYRYEIIKLTVGLYDFSSQRKLNRRQTYIGEFELDEDDPYFTAESNDQDGELRNVFVYRLKPVGSVYFREEDLCNSDISREIEIEESEAV